MKNDLTIKKYLRKVGNKNKWIALVGNKIIKEPWTAGKKSKSSFIKRLTEKQREVMSKLIELGYYSVDRKNLLFYSKKIGVSPSVLSNHRRNIEIEMVNHLSSKEIN